VRTALAGLVLAGASFAQLLAQPPSVPALPSVVTINGRQIIVQRRNPDGGLAPAAPYVIRGVNWSPAATTTDPASDNVGVRRPQFGQWYLTDIPLMKAMHVNTVRLFMDPGLPGDGNVTVPGLAVLDELYRNDIMVIMTVDNGNDTVARIQPVVDHYKNHPAVLMWSLGSEWNINRFFRPDIPTPADAAAAIESAAQMVKARDTGHPVVSSYGTIVNRPNDIEIYVNQTCLTIDVWSVNEYRGPGFGRLFDQWGFISGKPMFVAEYGIDAFNSRSGLEDQPTHALFGGRLWDEIARNLSADDPNRVASGATIFEWNDEWWKAPPPGRQDTGGWNPPGFPDGTASEDWFGVVTIQRVARQLFAALTTRFAAGYQPPTAARVVAYRAESLAPLLVRFWEAGSLMYQGEGATQTDSGGRGFNVAAIDPLTLRLRDPVKRFDTWLTRDSGTQMNAFIAYLDSQPNGTILLIAVGDEAGLNNFTTDLCSFLPHPWVAAAKQRLQALGSTQVQNICYRDQWSMVAIKGRGVALSEARSSTADAITAATLHQGWTDDPILQGSTTIRAVHVTELRSRIDLVRAAKGLASFAWTDSVAPLTAIRARHVTELRTALSQAYSASGMMPPAYTDPLLAEGAPIRSVHITEIRAAVMAIE